MKGVFVAAAVIYATLIAPGANGQIVFPFARAGVSSVGIQTVSTSTVVQPVAVGVFPVVVSVLPGGRFLANYPPARDCVGRALNLTRGCSEFLQAVADNGGQLTIMTIADILSLAKTNISADIACYNVAASFFNGGCLCDSTTIRLVQTFNSTPPIPEFAKQALVSLNRAKCPQPTPPPGTSASPSPSSSPSTTSVPATTVAVQPGQTVVLAGRRLKELQDVVRDSLGLLTARHAGG